MKNKYFFVTVLLVLAIILVNIPITVYASIFDMAHNLFEQYTNKTEEKIYAMKLMDSKESLLAEIKAMDKELSGSDKIAILPHAMALVEKKDEFSLKDTNSYLGIFKPKNCDITVTLANSINSKSRELRGISYTFWDQIMYPSNLESVLVRTQNITAIRCDGVIEYVYEWLG